jgi:hypothetical protein
MLGMMQLGEGGGSRHACHSRPYDCQASVGVLTFAALGSKTYLIKDSLMGRISGNSDSICTGHKRTTHTHQ